MKALSQADLDHILPRTAELALRFIEQADTRGKTWARLIDFKSVMHTLEDAVRGTHPYLQARVSSTGTHLFVFSVTAPWWDHRPWLMEQFFCRIRTGEGNPIPEVDALAIELGCPVAMVATSLAPSDEVLGRLLRRSGYVQQSTQYIKEIPWES